MLMFLSISKASVKQASFRFSSWSVLSFPEVTWSQGPGMGPSSLTPRRQSVGGALLLFNWPQTKHTGIFMASSRDNGKDFLKMDVIIWRALRQQFGQSWRGGSFRLENIFFSKTALQINEGIKVVGLEKIILFGEGTLHLSLKVEWNLIASES